MECKNAYLYFSCCTKHTAPGTFQRPHTISPYETDIWRDTCPDTITQTNDFLICQWMVGCIPSCVPLRKGTYSWDIYTNSAKCLYGSQRAREGKDSLCTLRKNWQWSLKCSHSLINTFTNILKGKHLGLFLTVASSLASLPKTVCGIINPSPTHLNCQFPHELHSQALLDLLLSFVLCSFLFSVKCSVQDVPFK